MSYRISAWTDPGLKRGDLIRRQVPPDPDALPFTAWMECPRCGRFDLHWLDAVDRTPPRVEAVQVNRTRQAMAWGYGPVQVDDGHRVAGDDDDPRELVYLLSREDERGYSVARRCRDSTCDQRWLHV